MVQPIFTIDIGWTNKAVRLYQEIAHQIELLISEGRLEPGDRLPPERALAGSFKVSRNCVREALRALAEKKLVESRQGDGTYVRDDAASDLARTFAEAFSAQRERIAEIFELRRAVEPGIAALAAEKATPRDIARLKAVVFDQERALEAGRVDPGLDAAFHKALAEATHNRVVGEIMTALTGTMAESRSGFLQSARRGRASLATHLALLAAVEAGDPEASRLAMCAHLDRVAGAVFAPGANQETD